MIASFPALLEPLDLNVFFAEYYERKHLHENAGADARRGLLSREEFSKALGQATNKTENIVCFPEYLGTTREELLANESIMREYLDAGHPLVWNRARGIAKRVDAMTMLLAKTFGAHVWPNVYATGTAGTPFDMHFDAHEVMAIHCEGEKTWDISRIRVDRPIEAREMEPAIRHALLTRRDEAVANITDSFTVRPGDLIYIPRGLFHNARTNTGRSLHVTFGIELPTGYDLAKRIIMDLLADPAMREYPLPLMLDSNGERSHAWCAALGAKLVRAYSVEAIAANHDDVQRSWMSKSNGAE